jgi:hypothetical protein
VPFGVSGRDSFEFPPKDARSASLIAQGAPGQTCRPLMSPRRSMRRAVILQTPMILAAASSVIPHGKGGVSAAIEWLGREVRA